MAEPLGVEAITFIDEADGSTILVALSGRFVPSLNDFVWLGGAEADAVEYKVEKLEHVYKQTAMTTVSNQVHTATNSTITITVSEVV